MDPARGGDPPHRDSLLGRTVGRYRIDASIGTGGMGEVFLAWDAHLNRSVAVKALRPELAAEPRARQRFVREARYACRVQHPFVCSVLDVVEDREDLFLVMEHVDGLRLDDVVERDRPSVDRVRDLAIEIAEALGAIHGAGLVHRDLKPSNVMVTADGHVKVMDFGVAQLGTHHRSPDGSDSTMTEEGFGVGTIAYMSPEQIRGRKSDARSDLFSLGIVLYQAITGEHPFDRGSPFATASAILNDPPGGGREPETLSTAGATRQIVMRLLEKEPAQRYATSEDLLRDLKAAKEGLRLAPLPRPTPRFGRATVWTAAALVIAAVAAGVTGYRSCAAPRETRPTVVVLPFGPTDGVDAQRGVMLADLIAAGLAETGDVRRISPDHLEEILTAQPAGVAPAELRRLVGAATGARWIVSGTVYRVGNTSEAAIDIHGEDVSPERTVRVAAMGSAGLVSAALGRLIAVLAPNAQPPAAFPTMDLSDDLLNRYADAVRAYREYRFGQAIAAFDAVIEKNSRFTGARRWQILSLERAGYEARALESARLLEALLRDPAATIPESELHWSRAAIATARGREADGVAAMRALLARHPDDVDAMRHLAALLVGMGQGDDGIALLDRALELEPGFVALRLARVGALQALNRFDEAESSLRSLSKDVPATAVSVRAAIERRWGELQQERGRLDEARTRYLETSTLLQRAERPLAAAIARGNAVQIDLLQGKVDDAAKAIEPLLALARSEGCHRFAIAQTTALGAACFQAGRLAEAQTRYREALALAREIGNVELAINPSIALASLLSITGRFGEARGLAEEAARAARARGDVDRERAAHVIRADALMAEGRLDEATAAFDELASAEGEGAAEGSTWARLGAAEARELRGDLVASDREATRAIEVARKGGRKIQFGYAASRRAETLARGGYLAGASAATKEGRDVAPVASLPDLALRLDWVDALAGAYGPSPGPVDRLEEVIRRARELGTTEVEHSALVALAETLCRRGESSAAIGPAGSVLDAPTARFANRVRARIALARALALSNDSGRASTEARRAFDEAASAGMRIETALAASLVVQAARVPDSEIGALRGSALSALAKVDSGSSRLTVGEYVPRWDIVDARETLQSHKRRP